MIEGLEKFKSLYAESTGILVKTTEHIIALEKRVKELERENAQLKAMSMPIGVKTALVSVNEQIADLIQYIERQGSK